MPPATNTNIRCLLSCPLPGPPPSGRDPGFVQTALCRKEVTAGAGAVEVVGLDGPDRNGSLTNGKAVWSSLFATRS